MQNKSYVATWKHSKMAEQRNKYGFLKKVHRRRKLYSSYERSLRDLDEGRMYEAKDVDDLFRQCLEEK